MGKSFDAELGGEESPLVKSPLFEDAKKQSDAAAHPSSVVMVVHGVLLGLLYIVVSAAMIFSLKFLMHPTRFPFAVPLASLHMATSFGLASGLLRLAPDLFPSVSTVFRSDAGEAKINDPLAVVRGVLQFVPVALFGALSVVIANGAYLHAGVSFLQMVKEGHVVMVYALMITFGMETPRWRTVFVLGCVAASAAVAVGGAARTSWTLVGLFMQLVAGLAQSIQVVLTNRLMSKSRGPKIDPLTTVLCTAPVMLCGLLPCNLLFWDPLIPARVLEWWPYLLGNMLLAFVLQVVSALTIKGISATGHALASVLKDLGIVFGAAALMGEQLTVVQLMGFSGSICGISVYSAMKLNPTWFEPRAAAGRSV